MSRITDLEAFEHSYITVQEFANYLTLHERTVIEWIKTGEDTGAPLSTCLASREGRRDRVRRAVAVQGLGHVCAGRDLSAFPSDGRNLSISSRPQERQQRRVLRLREIPVDDRNQFVGKARLRNYRIKTGTDRSLAFGTHRVCGQSEDWDANKRRICT